MFTNSKIKDIIESAVSKWINIIKNDSDISNKYKSKEWIKCLAKEFQKHFDNDIKIFPPSIENKNDTYKNRSEFLFDIHICETSSFRSIKHDKNINFVSKSLIAIESEFEKNTHAAAEDMSKLICSNAKLKIFVGPYYEKEKDSNYLTPLTEVANKISDIENFYCVLIPHPDEVKGLQKTENICRILQLIENEWVDL